MSERLISSDTMVENLTSQVIGTCMMLREKDNKSSHMSDFRKNAYERVNAAYSQRAREICISFPFQKKKRDGS